MPLKISTSGEDWPQWARRYRAEGAFIPKVYIVRADGEQLHGSSGSPRSSELKQLMLKTLSQSGRIYPARQAQALKRAVDEAKIAQSQNDRYTTVMKLVSMRKLGPLGNLQSFAESALEADKMVKALTEDGAEKLQSAVENLQRSPDSFDAALQYTEIDRIYGRLPTLKKEFSAAAGKVRRVNEAQTHLLQAKTISKARAVVSQGRSGPTRAKQYLKQIITKYPNAPAGKTALVDMAALSDTDPSVSADPSITSSAGNVSPAAQPRLWSDDTGKFKVQAILREVTSDTVVLKDTKGKTLRVPIARLSDQDRLFLEARNMSNTSVDREDTRSAPTDKSAPVFREWADDTGQFKIEAELVEFKDNQVKLRLRDGKLMKAAFERLSKQDQQYLLDRKRAAGS